MIKPEMVPDEVWMAARLELVDGPIREDWEDRYRHAIAAALNAWLGATQGYHGFRMDKSQWCLILPLAQKQEDGDGK